MVGDDFSIDGRVCNFEKRMQFWPFDGSERQVPFDNERNESFIEKSLVEHIFQNFVLELFLHESSFVVYLVELFDAQSLDLSVSYSSLESDIVLGG